MIIPSIDLSEGRAVQWRRGREPVLARTAVFELLERFRLHGEVAIVDLDAATGRGENRDLIHAMLARCPCRVGGGIRDLETARDYLRAGATRLVLGTACREPFVRALPRDAVVVALDAWEDERLDRGWTRRTGERIADAMRALAPRASEFLYTAVEREGMLAGLDRARVEAVLEASPLPVTVAGGITTAEDVAFLHRRGANAQIGMAIYTGKLDLAGCVLATVDFAAEPPLVPTVVKDRTSGDVLMLAWSSPESLRRALAERRGVYWSRSREAIWTKGETSGHGQRLCRVDVDCDGDTLLFVVEQEGAACHTGRWSCFGAEGRAFSLGTLDRVLEQRAAGAPAGSYTAKLLADPALAARKLREELEELIAARPGAETRWEAADLIYFALVQARARGVGLREITSELRSRHVDR